MTPSRQIISGPRGRAQVLLPRLAGSIEARDRGAVDLVTRMPSASAAASVHRAGAIHAVKENRRVGHTDSPADDAADQPAHDCPALAGRQTPHAPEHPPEHHTRIDDTPPHS